MFSNVGNVCNVSIVVFQIRKWVHRKIVIFSTSVYFAYIRKVSEQSIIHYIEKLQYPMVSYLIFIICLIMLMDISRSKVVHNRIRSISKQIT